MKLIIAKRCKGCYRALRGFNKSGFCSNCYTHRTKDQEEIIKTKLYLREFRKRFRCKK